MRTNVAVLNGCTNIPAGIFQGVELFARHGELHALYGGKRMLFIDLPSMEKRKFVDLYLQDVSGQKFIRTEFGVEGFEAGFKQWLFCKYGALDGNPDNVDTDAFNSACRRVDCPGRGKFCGCGSGLTSADMATLEKIVEGKTFKQIADELYLSLAAVKSRVNKLRIKFNVANVAALSAVATAIGIK